MKTLICIDGQAHSLEATKLAARLTCAEQGEVTFLFVRRYRKDVRGYNIRRKTTEVFANWEELPELKYLQQAKDVFRQACGVREAAGGKEETQKALVHLGDGVFEEGLVQLCSEAGIHLKIREGVPHEEIISEAEQGHYDLVFLGAHHSAGCRWFDIEHVPLEVVRKVTCPIAVISKEVTEGQPILLYVEKKDIPAPSSLQLGREIATRLQGEIQILAIQKKTDPVVQFDDMSSLLQEWTDRSIKVTSKVLIGDPVKIILERASQYGLIMCVSGGKWKRLSKVVKKVISCRFNLLVTK